MKYVVEYKPIGNSPMRQIAECESTDVASKIINDHAAQFYFPNDSLKAEFIRDHYRVSEIVEDWHEERLGNHWARQVATINRDGKQTQICGAMYQK